MDFTFYKWTSLFTNGHHLAFKKIIFWMDFGCGNVLNTYYVKTLVSPGPASLIPLPKKRQSTSNVFVVFSFGQSMLSISVG